MVRYQHYMRGVHQREAPVALRGLRIDDCCTWSGQALGRGPTPPARRERAVGRRRARQRPRSGPGLKKGAEKQDSRVLVFSAAGRTALPTACGTRPTFEEVQLARFQHLKLRHTV